MKRWLRDRRLQERRAFLQRAVRGPADSGDLRDSEPPAGSPNLHGPAIVPEPLSGDAAKPPPDPRNPLAEVPGGKRGDGGEAEVGDRPTDVPVPAGTWPLWRRP